MNPIDALLAQYVTPHLHSKGFRKGGRSYNQTSNRGDTSIITIAPVETGPSKWSFFVNLAVAPEPYVDLRHYEFSSGKSRPKILHDGYGLWRGKLNVPESYGYREWFPEEWWLETSSDIDRCGPPLVRALDDTALPRIEQLSDRADFISELRNGELRPEEIQLRPPVRALIALLVNDAPAGELRRLLSQAGSPWNEDDKFHEWVLAKLDGSGVASDA